MSIPFSSNNRLTYPTTISFQDLIKLYYILPERPELCINSYISLTLDSGKRVACAPKFSRFPEGFDEYFTVTKSSKKTNVITQKQIKKRFPYIDFEEKEQSYYHQLRVFIERTGRFPTQVEEPTLFNHIKDIVDAQDHLDPVEKERHEALPGWLWEYSRLTPDGVLFESFFAGKISEPGVKKKLYRHLKEGKLSPYFKNKLKNLTI